MVADASHAKLSVRFAYALKLVVRAVAAGAQASPATNISG